MADFITDACVGTNLAQAYPAVSTSSLSGTAGLNPPFGPQQNVGDKKTSVNGTFEYCKASGTITQYDLVYITSAGVAASATTALVTTTQAQKLGAAQIGATDGQFLWIQIEGLMNLRTPSTTTSANVAAYTTATAGLVDDGDASGVKIIGLNTGAGNSSGSAATVAMFGTEPLHSAP